MSSPSSTLRKRGAARGDNAEPAPSSAPSAPDRKPSTTPPSEWDYYVGLAIMTVLAFVTRFWRINHPSEVVFDEVHFGKVRNNLLSRRGEKWKG